ncbi:hypothetical protein Tco_1249009 [Tanacetum coccineum]
MSVNTFLKNAGEMNGKKEIHDKGAQKENLSATNSKEVREESVCFGHFKHTEIPRSGGSILQVMDDLVKVGVTMGYNMEGCIKNIEEIIGSQGVNETKLETIDLFIIKRCWGNFNFDYAYSPSVGNSGVWMPNGKYEVQTNMSADMSVRATRWQAEVSVRGTRYCSRWRLANQSVTRGIWRVSVRGQSA